MMIVYAAGVTMALVVSVPDWPYFNQHPLKWLDPIEETTPSSESAGDQAQKKPVKKAKNRS
eukprot:CAMPEP_0177599072 /NCGR_PEP_ID=MMETSP0419_2-20121207/12764_1 /TAXON_ID=582737 /ORGANISM="Tetraselmis sp., Strain GSL018" /LENGTH=60 /DNA_ID=CAMNT_0019091713 /DNA_START=465 /DNA_END=647 /DNA_ORIENTATION=-